MDFTIRTARPEEYARAGELTADVYLHDGLLEFGASDPYLAVLRDAEQRAAQAELLVAVEPSGTVLGSVTYVGDGGPYAELADEREAEFRMLAVSGAARGRGVGEALVRACLDRSRERQRERVVISSLPEMTTAHRLYGRLGFVRAPHRDWEPLPDLPLWAFTVELSSEI
ncbi:GNAT family N-acetyltransferase [Streptomyces boncukensis]|uniref:GNAT family N-acetyltransferase n=1 Tax=Streptomyces boncukensis TaxID=2711219 RepID=A0A6G4X3I6_9ACTN|nr:GNAT family N-acetyltransferase [Streptomyces boncukensis]NGO71948.1 GNAT family N-acetyltransferase [Streptomyces boncukensis]